MNNSPPLQVLPSVLYAVNIVARIIEFIGVDIKLVAASVPEYEIALPCVIAISLLVALRGKQLSQPRYLLVSNRDIKVQVSTRLVAQQGVNRPPAVHVNLKAVLLQ